jgi:hypothetical protein
MNGVWNWKQWPWTPPQVIVQDKAADLTEFVRAYDKALAELTAKATNAENRLKKHDSEIDGLRSSLMGMYQHGRR